MTETIKDNSPPRAEQQAAVCNGLGESEEATEETGPSVPNVLLETLLSLMSAEERQRFLKSATEDGIVFSARVPKFDKPLTVRLRDKVFSRLMERIVQEKFLDLAGLLPAVARDRALEFLRTDLEDGVRFSPPPADWYANRRPDEEMPIRVQSRRFSVPCKLSADKYTRDPVLFATYVGGPDENRGTRDDPAINEPPEQDELPPIDEEDDVVERQLVEMSVSPTAAAEQTAVAEELFAGRDSFVPHVRTAWTVRGPGNFGDDGIDVDALERLVRQLEVNRCGGAVRAATRRRVAMLNTLALLVPVCKQYRFEWIDGRGEECELSVKAPAPALQDIEFAHVFVDDEGPESGNPEEAGSADGNQAIRQAGPIRRATANAAERRLGRRQVRGLSLEGLEVRGQRVRFRVSGSEPLPRQGFLMDAGTASQVKKQVDALRLIAAPTTPAMAQLGSFIGGPNLSKMPSVQWENVVERFVDDKLTPRQREAVAKALSTPDVCLIQGPPGTGKTRVISEIVRQAARRGWRVLLTAPTHVAVDNVLERIGWTDEVSPIRCASERRISELPDHIRGFTYGERSVQLTTNALEAVRRHLDELKQKQDQLAADAALLDQCQVLYGKLETLEKTQGSLQGERAAAPERVRQQHSARLSSALKEFNEAQKAKDLAEVDQSSSRRAKQSAAERLLNLDAGRYSVADQAVLAARLIPVDEQHGGLLAAARRRLAQAKEDVITPRKLLDDAITERKRLETDVEELSTGRIPLHVASEVDIAANKATAEEARRLQMAEDRFGLAKTAQDRLSESLMGIRADLDRNTRRKERLREVTLRRAAFRMFSATWWASWITDFAAEVERLQRELAVISERHDQARIDTTNAEIAQAELQAAYDQARTDATAAAVAACLKNAKSGRESIALEVPPLQFALQEAEAAVSEAHEQLSRAEADHACDVEAASTTFRTELLRAASRTQQEATEAENRDAQMVEAAAERCLGAKAAKEFVEKSIAADIVKRLTELDQKLLDAAAETNEIRQQIVGRLRSGTEALISTLARAVGDTAIPSRGEINAAQSALAGRRAEADNRGNFLRQWATYLEENAPVLKDHLANYVNLVCATVMGIATDRRFGDDSPRPPGPFDLLVIDEAGKVTEIEFLVAATRAKQWVLVGDHKQLPPFYDGTLDPYIAAINERRSERSGDALDPAAVKLSFFERLWNELSPISELPVSPAGPDPDDELAWEPGHDARTSRDHAWRVIEESRRAWELRHSLPASGPKPDRKEAATPGRQETGADTSESSARPRLDSPGEDRRVLLDVQRRMHPDLARFIRDVFYPGEYHSPPDPAFAESKLLRLAHLPKAITFINVVPSKKDGALEIDISRPRAWRAIGEDPQGLPEAGYANPSEARRVIDVLEAVVSDEELHREQRYLDDEGDRVPTVGIIAFYSAQVALIRRLIKRNPALCAESAGEGEFFCRGIRVAVNSVHAFQGKECPVIMVSFTRSNPAQRVGFVDDPHVINVALSRARKKLVLIGDSDTLVRRARKPVVKGQANNGSERPPERVEREMFARLVQYVQEGGELTQIFEIRRGNAT